MARRSKQKQPAGIREEDLDFQRIAALRYESDEVREALKVNEEENSIPVLAAKVLEEIQMQKYRKQLDKFADSLSAAEFRLLEKINLKQGVLPVSEKRMQTVESINELADIYLHRPVLECKGKKIRQCFTSDQELLEVLRLALEGPEPARERPVLSSAKSSRKARKDPRSSKKAGFSRSNSKASSKIQTNSMDLDDLERLALKASKCPENTEDAGWKMHIKKAVLAEGYDLSQARLKQEWLDLWDKLDSNDIQVLKILYIAQQYQKHYKWIEGYRPAEWRQKQLEKLAAECFGMPDMLVDQLNLKFEEQFQDILVDGDSCEIFPNYLKDITFLFKGKEMD